MSIYRFSLIHSFFCLCEFIGLLICHRAYQFNIQPTKTNLVIIITTKKQQNQKICLDTGEVCYIYLKIQFNTFYKQKKLKSNYKDSTYVFR